MDVQTHTLATHTQRIAIMLWKGKNSSEGTKERSAWDTPPPPREKIEGILLTDSAYGKLS